MSQETLFSAFPTGTIRTENEGTRAAPFKCTLALRRLDAEMERPWISR
jgi:hypothetical protein